VASIKKRPDGKWRARYRDGDGREHSKHFARKVDAQDWLDGVTADVVTGRWVDPRRAQTRFGVYSARWIEAQPLRPTSRRTWSAYLRLHIDPAFGHRPLAAVNKTDVMAFQRGLQAHGLAPNTRRAIHGLLLRILSDAVEDGYLPRSPGVGTLPTRPPRQRIVPVSVEEVARLVEEMPPRYRAAVVLGAGCGLRIGEVLGLRQDRVRFLARELDVVEQLILIPGGPPFLAPPKTNASVRTVPMAQWVIDALAEHLAADPAGAQDLVFRSKVGTPIWPNTFASSVWGPARKRAGLRHVRFHDLRHHFASLLIEAGESVKTVSALLGHADEVETLRTYTHLWPDAVSRARSVVDAAHARRPAADSLRTEQS
jgi:integrase